jgi:hypothetical protein
MTYAVQHLANRSVFASNLKNSVARALVEWDNIGLGIWHNRVGFLCEFHSDSRVKS